MKEKHDLESVIDKEMEEMLSYYVIDDPDEQEINKTIENLRMFLPEKKKSPFMTMKELIKMDIKNFFYLDAAFYLSNLLFFAGGLLYCVFLQGNPYLTVMALSPIPFILGLLEVFKGRDHSLFELELSCKYSASQLIATKITVISIYNLLLSGSLITILSLFGTNWVLEMVIVYWFVPFSVVSVISLFTATKFRSMMVVPPVLAVWVIILFMIVKVPFIQQKFEIISLQYAPLIGILSWFFIIYHILKFKRGVTIDSIY